MADLSIHDANAAVVEDKAILGGEPVFKDTRVPVRLVADMLADGVAEEEILTGYPTLQRRQLRLATLWVAAYPLRSQPKTLKERGYVPISTKRLALGSKA